MVSVSKKAAVRLGLVAATAATALVLAGCAGGGASGGSGSTGGPIVTVEAKDPTTVVFHLKNGNDQTFAQVLSTAAGAIVDEEVFAADAVTTDDDIVKGNAFSGQYVIKSYNFNNLVTFAKNKNYEG